MKTSTLIPQSEIQAFLHKLGASAKYVGFHHTTQALQLVLEEPDRLSALIKSVYVEIADTNGASASSVERSIRTMIGQIWRDGDRDFLDEVAGRHLLKPPTNGEFLDMSAHYLTENN